jgi:hypothetical protein
MTTQVFDNYFSLDYFYSLKNKVMEENFKWTFGTKLNHNQINNNDTYFVHNIYQNHIPLTVLWEDIDYILNEHLHARGVLRAKANLYLKTPEIVEHAKHVDFDIPHKGAIIYLNTCDGFTRLDDGTKIESVENRLLLFDSSKPHNSTSTTNAIGRYNININYV